MATLDEKGHEILDDTPVAIPVKFMRAQTLTDQVRALISVHASQRAADDGFETFEEANDFDIPDEYDPASIHEEVVAMELEEFIKDVARDKGWVDPAERDAPKRGAQANPSDVNSDEKPEQSSPGDKPDK